MALVRTVGWSLLTTQVLDEAFEYAGGTLATLHTEVGAASGTVTGFVFYVGEGTTNRIAGFAIGGSSNKCFVNARAQSAGSDFGGSYAKASDNVRVVATKSCVAVTNVDADSVSKMGIVFTTDSNGNLCCVLCGADAQTLANPAVVPRDALYTAKVTYPASTSNAFGATALSKIPVPSYDGNARYLPKALFAHATQYQIDGPVLLNSLTKFYCIGGSWFLDDSEGAS